MRGQSRPVGFQIALPNGYYNERTEDGWKLAHYVVMEKYLGRPIGPGERVYFRNKGADKAHPDPADLEVRVVKPRKERSNATSGLTKKELEIRFSKLEATVRELETSIEQYEDFVEAVQPYLDEIGETTALEALKSSQINSKSSSSAENSST